MPRIRPLRPRQSIISPDSVYQDPDALPGTECFNIYDMDGKRIAKWTAVLGTTDEILLESFRDFLSRRGYPKLALIPPSSAS